MEQQGTEYDAPARMRSGVNAIAGWRAFAKKPSDAKWRADYSEKYSGGCRGRNEPMDGLFISPAFEDRFFEISEALKKLRDLNSRPETRSRELSLAITEIETGLLWLSRATASDEA